MANVHLRKRYLMVFNDGTTEMLNLNPEEKYYFEEQETLYLALCIDALKKENLEKYKNLLYI